MIEQSKSRIIKSVFIVAVLAIGSIFSVVGPAIAQPDNSKQPIVANCQELEAKLGVLIETFSGKRQDHLDKYKEISELYSAMTVKLASTGYDTAILEELQPGFDSKIEQFGTESEQFISELTDVKDSACRERSSFLMELEEARSALKDVQLSVADVQGHVQDVLLPAVRNLINFSGN